mgnify:CR=1 FL=1
MASKSRAAVGARTAGVLCVLACVGGVASGQSIYSADFEGGTAGPEWSLTALSQSPSGRNFLGRLGNDAAVLTLSNVPAQTVQLEFDLYIIGTWDGNDNPGPDRWMLDLVGGQTLLSTTFAVGDETSWRTQAYPNAEGAGANTNRSGATENNSLGYIVYGFQRDAVWHMTYQFENTDPTLAVRFSAAGLQQLEDESWGLDNVGLTLIPAPGAAGVLGLAGLAMFRRRR